MSLSTYPHEPISTMQEISTNEDLGKRPKKHRINSYAIIIKNIDKLASECSICIPTGSGPPKKVDTVLWTIPPLASKMLV